MKFNKPVGHQILRIKKKLEKVFLYSEKEIKKAKNLRVNQDYSQAEMILGLILQKQPANYYALMEFAQIAHEKASFSLASQLWDQLLSIKHLPTKERNKYILMASESWLENKQKDKMKKFLSPLQESFPEANLGLANSFLDDHQSWCMVVNHFFKHFSLNEIFIDKSANSFYTSLSGSPKQLVDKTPKVSVIMSAYNAEKYLAFAAKSILNQSWKNLELIIVNDKSTDKTFDIAKQLEAQDPRVKIINNSSNVGTYVCRNLALDISDGDFVTTHDSDDWAHPERIRLQAENLLHNDHIANLTRSVRVLENGRFELTSWGSYLSDRCCVSFMIKKNQALQLFGYWDSVRVSGDVEYIERVYAVLGKKSIQILPEPLIFQLRHGDSLTTAPLTMGVAGRVSSIRETYKKNYQAWHKKLLRNNCRISFPQDKRPFPAPIEMIEPPPKQQSKNKNC